MNALDRAVKGFGRWIGLDSTDSLSAVLPSATPSTNNDWSRALYSYKNTSVKKMIFRIKYSYNPKLNKYFGRKLADEINQMISEKHPLETEWLITPIPMTLNRRWKRGFNPSSLLVKACLSSLPKENFKYMNTLKKKGGTTQGQAKNREARLAIIRGRFTVPNKELVSSKNIVIIDDVIATGATLNEARNTLLESGAKNVIGVAVAH